MKFQNGRGDRVELNLTPLIDVVFILLMFFIVTTTFNRYAQLKIELPETSVTSPTQTNRPLELAIDAAGDYYLNGRALINTQPATLVTALKLAAAKRLDMPLAISADRRTPYQAVVTAMDAATQVGLTRVSLPTTQAEEPP